MEPKSKALENLVLITQIGISMLIPIGVGLYIGKWIDDKFKTAPIFLFVFIIIGVISAFMNLFKMTEKDAKTRKRK